MSDLPSRYDLSIPGFTIGHGSDLDGKTGVSVVLCPDGAVAAAEVRGTATGTRQFDSLSRAHHVATKAHAVVLAGGSGYGLSAADAVVRWLEAHGYGFDTGIRRVPLVPTAILFDLAFGSPEAAPTAELVERAIASAADGEQPSGSVGAGTGATVGKALGPAQGMKGGVGFVAVSVPDGPTVAALVAVNAFGDVRHPETGRRLAGCRSAADSVELVGSENVLVRLPPDQAHPWQGNTTLAVVMTDAALGKPEARKVCEMAFGAFYRCLVPALGMFDGDLVVTLAAGRIPAQVHQIGVLGERVVAEAIV
ncbi:MAG: P1 family peptidase, partial [Thermoanaerobaculia bacterium]|nr:P1 family peptidase [Thermoanaerobaculia bacterium]